VTELNEIQREFLVEGLDDYVGLWQWVDKVRDRCPDLDDDAVRAKVLELVGELMQRNAIQAGPLYVKGGFDAWELPPAEALERIGREWIELGRDPSIPDICWFSNTEHGDALASADRAAPGGG
jgi:hypothetical protein